MAINTRWIWRTCQLPRVLRHLQTSLMTRRICTLSDYLLHRYAHTINRLVAPGKEPDELPYVIVDPTSFKLTKGSTIHFATELIGSSFRVEHNPQAKGAGCGCGVSWELKPEVEV